VIEQYRVIHLARLAGLAGAIAVDEPHAVSAALNIDLARQITVAAPLPRAARHGSRPDETGAHKLPDIEPQEVLCLAPLGWPACTLARPAPAHL
jgi:hypothetical protein